VSSSFVPVAVDLFQVRSAKDEAGRFFKAVDAQKHQYQGLWLATWDARVLAGSMDGDPDWTGKVLTALNSGLNAFGGVSPRRAGLTNPYPIRGIGVQPDGGVRLAVIDKTIHPRGLLTNLPLSAVAEMKIDSVRLSASQWSAFTSPDPEVGSKWAIAEEVGRQFFPLLNFNDTKFVDPSEVTEVALTGRVGSIRNGIAHLVFRGGIAGRHRGTANEGRDGLQMSTTMKIIDGVGNYEIRSAKMISLTLVWEGSASGWYPRSSADPPGTARFGALVEWRRSEPNVTSPLESQVAIPETKVEHRDATPEEALKTFLCALAAHDETTLRAVALPDPELDLLLRGPVASPEQLATIRARLDALPMRRLKLGDPVTMPSGEERAIAPDDVREGRVVLWPGGAPLPSRVELVGGHWRVFARPFIAARKTHGDKPPE
jgi:hypothetical protein